ncbi:protein MARD1-like isoform X1 [Canna indica]|uniref:Protein MARD1-like isoform X1 n=1 Tax=Canna indica TaxID=4628 RepID=A0AAQ3JZH2_9LILI|nr:protein MARD1-like isoform X1 [Canna indica]
MLKERSKAVSSKQRPMSSPPSLSSPISASLFTSPRLFVGFSPKAITDPETGASPTSILETKPSSAIRNPFFPTANRSSQIPQQTGVPRAIGLGLLDVLANEDSISTTCKPERRVVVFGSQLKIQVPSPPTESGSILNTTYEESLNSPIEFAMEATNSQLALYSPTQRSPGLAMLNSSPRVLTGCLPPSKMEQSEDYTCVILHGPNPKTTHIYDNCIIESCSNECSTSMKETGYTNDQITCAADDFSSFCYGCRKKINPKEDIYMSRGEKAFCSRECSYEELMSEE